MFIEHTHIHDKDDKSPVCEGGLVQILFCCFVAPEVITVLLLSNNYVLAIHKQVMEHIYQNANCE